MGIAVNENTFNSVEIMKDLEKARNALALKRTQEKKNSKNNEIEQNTIVENYDMSDSHVENSESEGFIVVESRKKTRGRKKKIMISPAAGENSVNKKKGKYGKGKIPAKKKAS